MMYNNMINKNIAIFIDDLTEKIIDAYNIQIPIMNMKEVLKSIGGKIVYKNNYYELIDGNIITSKGPATAMLFSIALLEVMTNTQTAAKVAQGLLFKF